MDNNYEIFKDLIKEYEKLSLEEKQAILIYKSRLFNLINSITSIHNFKDLTSKEIILQLTNVEQLQREILLIKDVLDLKENMVVKYSIFKNIHLDNFELLIDDLKKVYFILERAKDKIILDRDLIVYRGISIDKDSKLSNIARGNLISTSIKIDDVDSFICKGNSSILYIIKLKKGTPVLVSPISLVLTYKDTDDYLGKKLKGEKPTLLKLMNRDNTGQQEVLLFKDTLSFVIEKQEEKYLDDDNISIVYIDTYPNAEIYKNNLKKNHS